MRGRFDIQTSDSLFLQSEAQDSNLPIDAVPVFVEKSWEVIRNQKELNLPDQREMVASYRCNELREEASAMIKKDMQALQQESNRGVIDKFNTRCSEILDKALSFFNEAVK